MICEFCLSEVVGVNTCPSCGAPTPQINLNNKDSKLKQSEPLSNLSREKWRAGQYIVGTDIPAGEYVIIANKDGGSIEIKEDESDEDSLVLECFDNRLILTIEEGRFFEITDATAYSFQNAPKVELKNNTIPDGMYKVGVDLPAGEYKVKNNSGIEYGNVEISSDSMHNDDSTILDETVEGSLYITVEDGQYLELTDVFLKLN